MNRTGTQLLSGRWLTRHPWRVLVLTVALAALIGGGVAGLGFKNDYRIYFGKDNPELLAYDAIQSVYNKSDNILFVLEPASASAFTVETLSAIVELTNKAWQLPYSSRVDSLTNYQHTVADGDDIVVGDLVPDPAKLSEAELESVKRIALGEPSLLNRLVSPSGHVAGVDVTLQLPSDDPFAVVEAAERARELARELEGQYPGLKLHLTGMVMLNDAFSEAVMQDNKTLVPIMYLLLFATLMLCLRSLSATLSVMLLIPVAIAMALGAAGWFGWFLTPTSAMAPPIIMTMAVADCVHILVTQLHSMRLGAPKHLAIQESLRINFQPILLTSVTTAIGFLSLNFSDAPPFRDLGNIVAIGVLWAWLLSLTLLPALMMILPVNIAPGKEPDRTVMVDLAGFVIRRRKSLLLVNGLAALVLIGLAPRNALNDEFVKYFDQTVDFRRSTDFLDANLGGMYTLELSIHAGGDGAVNEPVFLERLEALVDWLRAQPEVRNVDSITDVFKRLNKNMHRDRPEWYKLPAERELAAQYLLLYEMSLPYGLDLNDRVDIDKSSVRLIVTLTSLSSNHMLALEQRVRDWLNRNMPATAADIASPILMFAHIGQRNIAGMIAGTMAALVLISLILIPAFRSLKLGLISLVPNLVPAGIAFGIWSLVDGTIGLGLSVVTGMTLGIVVDDTVHFISKYQRVRLENGFAGEQAVRYAFATVGVAMWITSFVLVCGFVVLGLSHFNLNSSMGIMTAITIVIALIMDLFLLPPLLMTFEKT